MRERVCLFSRLSEAAGHGWICEANPEAARLRQRASTPGSLAANKRHTLSLLTSSSLFYFGLWQADETRIESIPP